MSLLDKIEDKTLPAHEFMAALQGWFVNDFGIESNVRTAIIDEWSLDASDESQLDESRVQYNAQDSALTKFVYATKLEQYAMLLQSGFITQAQFKSAFGWA